MSLAVMTGLIGLLYILVFGGMSLLRREGLSTRFAVEALIITLLTVAVITFLSIPIHPVIFVLVLYLITMRVRILVDLANMFARRGNFARAESVYSFASHIGPDATSRLIVDVNHAIMRLQENKLDEAITSFAEILSQANSGNLGAKYEAAAHFNLAVAYLRKGNPSNATIEFNATIDAWPASLYAHHAQQALNRQHKKDTSPVDDQSAGS